MGVAAAAPGLIAAPPDAKKRGFASFSEFRRLFAFS